jgi:proteasome assembly chaperone (PAC2) family protein
MTTEEKKIFETTLQKVFKLTAEEMAGLYNEAGELTDLSLIEQKDAEKICELFEKDFYTDVAMIRDAIKKYGMFNI